jgi:hypothetical protein
MLVYTLLFTQVGQSPETNPYISKFAKWLAHIIHFGDLNYLDTVILIIDDVTKEFFDKDHKLYKQIAALPFNFHYYRIQQPFSKIEGICEKYTCSPNLFSSYSMNLFIDLNYLVIGPLKPSYSLLNSKKTLYVQKDLQPHVFGFVDSSELIYFFNRIVKGCFGDLLYTSDKSVFNTYILHENVLQIGFQFLTTDGIIKQAQQPQSEGSEELRPLPELQGQMQLQMQMHQHEQAQSEATTEA